MQFEFTDILWATPGLLILLYFVVSIIAAFRHQFAERGFWPAMRNNTQVVAIMAGVVVGCIGVYWVIERGYFGALLAIALLGVATLTWREHDIRH